LFSPRTTQATFLLLLRPFSPIFNLHCYSPSVSNRFRGARSANKIARSVARFVQVLHSFSPVVPVKSVFFNLDLFVCEFQNSRMA
jgi:hypothetical protein